jgi:hypothetical protein
MSVIVDYITGDKFDKKFAFLSVDMEILTPFNSLYIFRLCLRLYSGVKISISTDRNVNKYRLIHGHFHIGLVIISRPILARDGVERANMGRGMITRPIWKCPCIKLFITYFRHLEKRHPYWPETKSKPILARANMGLDMEMIL